VPRRSCGRQCSTFSHGTIASLMARHCLQGACTIASLMTRHGLQGANSTLHAPAPTNPTHPHAQYAIPVLPTIPLHSLTYPRTHAPSHAPTYAHPDLATHDASSKLCESGYIQIKQSFVRLDISGAVTPVRSASSHSLVLMLRVPPRNLSCCCFFFFFESFLRERDEGNHPSAQLYHLHKLTRFLYLNL
jgi:hypothetical protein